MLLSTFLAVFFVIGGHFLPLTAQNIGFYPAFCCKTQSYLLQIALRFAAKREVFWC